MCTQGCNNSETLRSTIGPKGDPGATGGIFEQENFNTYNPSGNDIYNGGSGYSVAMLPTKDVAGDVAYNGVLYLSATDVGNVSIAPLIGGVVSDPRTTFVTYPPAVASKSYLSVPIAGTIAVGTGQSLSFRVLASSGIINAKLLRADINFIQL